MAASELPPPRPGRDGDPLLDPDAPAAARCRRPRRATRAPRRRACPPSKPSTESASAGSSSIRSASSSGAMTVTTSCLPSAAQRADDERQVDLGRRGARSSGWTCAHPIDSPWTIGPMQAKPSSSRSSISPRAERSARGKEARAGSHAALEPRAARPGRARRRRSARRAERGTGSASWCRSATGGCSRRRSPSIAARRS